MRAGVVGFEVFPCEPSAQEVVVALESICKQRGPPKHIVSDQGVQFRQEYRAWCTRRGASPRFGAIGKHGSIAVIERFMRTLKSEGLRRLLVPLDVRSMRDEVAAFVRWYDQHRPHRSLAGKTPQEVRLNAAPARSRPAFEPRARFPTKRALRGKRGDGLQLCVQHLGGRTHLPIVSLAPRRAA